MHRYAADLITHQFTFAGMQPGTNFDVERPDHFANGQRAPYAPGRAIKCGKETITGCIDFLTMKARQFLPDKGVMSVEQPMPFLVTEAFRQLCRLDNVCEQHSGQDAVMIRRFRGSGQKFLHFIEHRGTVTSMVIMITAVQLHENGILDVVSEVAAVADPDVGIVRTMKNQCWHSYGCQCRAYVAFISGGVHGSKGPRAHGQAFQPSAQLESGGIVGLTRRRIQN